MKLRSLLALLLAAITIFVVLALPAQSAVNCGMGTITVTNGVVMPVGSRHYHALLGEGTDGNPSITISYNRPSEGKRYVLVYHYPFRNTNHSAVIDSTKSPAQDQNSATFLLTRFATREGRTNYEHPDWQKEAGGSPRQPLEPGQSRTLIIWLVLSGAPTPAGCSYVTTFYLTVERRQTEAPTNYVVPGYQPPQPVVIEPTATKVSGQQKLTPPQPTATATATRTAVPPTATATSEPTATPTATAIPPTATATTIPSPTATATPAYQPFDWRSYDKDPKDGCLSGSEYSAAVGAASRGDWSTRSLNKDLRLVRSKRCT